jgi:glutaconyl-CoA/methylmalonyl-CoA decarboxylase subunit gamma
MAETFVVTLGSRTYTVALEDLADGGAPGRGGTIRAIVDGQEHVIDARQVADGTWSLVEGADARIVDVDGVHPGKLMVEISHPDGDPRQTSASVTSGTPDPRERAGAGPAAAVGAASASGKIALRAPIPGKVVKIAVKVGDKVRAGQTLLVLEAMKMENELRAPRDAAVLAIHAAEGTAVEAGHELLSLG